MNFRRIVLALLALVFLAPTAWAQSQERSIRVFAAASLTDALNELGDAYASAGHPRPVFNFAASSVLARQIDQGANADLYISADEPWMDYLAERRLIDARSRVSFLSNRLVLIAPIDEPLRLQIRHGFDLHRALNGRRLAMADPDSVPAGRYGRAALQSLGVWSAVQGDVVRAENVRAALRFVELGEAAAGVVYLTDARASSRVTIVGEFPAVSYPRISYPMAVVRGGRAAEASAFAAFLQSGAGDATFSRLGFILQ
ncbi:MAG: molybdate ABC transporter substrate-binding protein [Hyphomonadaceae bacterium]|nr:molybdate ABC transporter substrate-binding protein [Hyphomonadaceae bacterium]